VTRRIGVLGGTFDPIHCGHLDAARAADAAIGFDRLIVIPSNVPPHRPQPAASSFHRFAMAALAVSGRHPWQLSDLELRDERPSYTWTTLERLRQQYEPRELFFIIGGDAFAEIESWKRYPELLDAAHFAVVSRPGWPVTSLPARLRALASRMRIGVDGTDAGDEDRTWLFLLDAQTTDVSGTEIRRRVAAGEPLAGLVPAAVAEHILRNGLYRPNEAGRLHGKE